jgi:hypothetical protein
MDWPICPVSSPPDHFEASQQILGPHSRAFVAAQIMQHFAAVHHDDPVAEVDGLVALSLSVGISGLRVAID